MSLSNTALDLTGTTINLKNDLGAQDQRFPGFDLILRPSVKHKFRVQLVPVHYAPTATPRSPLNFGGQTFPAGVPISSKVHWRAWRFGYEYDAVVAPRGFLGFLLDVKYTDVDASLTSAVGGTRSASSCAPVPAIGEFCGSTRCRIGTDRRISGFKWPGGWIWSGSGDYLDFDVCDVDRERLRRGVRLSVVDVNYTVTNK
jgi:hypothetical protein